MCCPAVPMYASPDRFKGAGSLPLGCLVGYRRCQLGQEFPEPIQDLSGSHLLDWRVTGAPQFRKRRYVVGRGRLWEKQAITEWARASGREIVAKE
jgi:hypothetical protein